MLKNSIRFWIRTIPNGIRLVDKLYLFYLALAFFITLPIKFTNKLGMLHWKDVLIKNSDGTYYCRRGCPDLNTCDPQYEKQIRKFFEIKNGIFIDVGAHIGKYTVVVGKKIKEYNGKVIAIEPEELNFTTLLTNIKLNNLDSVVIPFNYACYSRNSIVKLFMHADAGHSLVVKTSKYKEVKAKTLDNIVKQLNLSRVDLIKIDTECAEKEILLGSSNTIKKFKPNIIFESWTSDHTEACRRVLENFNYIIEEIADFGTGKYYLATSN